MPRFGVVFDLDGLLVDSERVQALSFNVALAPHGVVLDDEAFGRLVGFSTRRNFEDLARLHPALAPHIASIHAAKDRAYRDLVDAEMRPMPGAVDLVRRLASAGIPIAVASSSPRVDVVACLRRIGVLDVLSTVSPGDEVAHPKPAPDVYLRAVGMLGLPGSRCVAIEDAGAGVDAAKAAGMACVAVPNRYTLGNDFGRADAVVSSLEDVTIDRLESLAAPWGRAAGREA